MSAIDTLISACCAIGKIGVANDMRAEIRRLKAPRCGNCNHWMKSSDCPLEVANRPSMNHLPCQRHSWKRSDVNLIAQRERELADYLEGKQ